ncbi:glycosylphosphatidylinositol anchor biosynthesis [Coemansia sp. RSA 1939]|nr:glycosylphosphatidylinositol anchor biosynthesis [Coemansia sp. RSA 1939]
MGFVQRHLFLTLLALRLANVYAVQTFTHPDETWQSLEVAHHVVFGYGFLTWEWRHALRGFAHPLLFAAVYKILAFLHLDDTFLLILCSVMSLSMGTDIVRPLVNSVETALTAAAFALWPWSGCDSPSAISGETNLSRKPARAYANDDIKSVPAALALAAMACIIRPTSGVVWLSACAFLAFGRSHLARHNGLLPWTVRRALRIAKIAMAVGSVAFPTMLVVDRLGYKRWVFPPYQFYRFNVQQDLATWFGESHVLYHFYASVPVLFTSMLPFVIHGVYIAFATRRVSTEPALLAAVVLVQFSLVSHMEYRFIYPLLPIGFMYAGVSIDTLAGHLPMSVTADNVASYPTPSQPASKHANDNSKYRKNPAPASKRLSVRTVLIYLFVTNIPAILYVDLVHQRGVMDVFKYLRRNSTSGKSNSVTSVGFLMPCHSTPFYSHLHRNIPMWFLSCEPPLERSAMDSHYWEANDFEQNPTEFIRDIFSTLPLQHTERTQHEQPSHLVLYGSMVSRIRDELNDLGYVETARFFNSHFNPDSRRRGDVVVLRKQFA